MSENSGKRLAWIISLILALLTVGYWYKSTRPKPVKKPPLAVVGVGLYLERNQKTRQFEVRRVFPGSPAEQAGIAPGMILNKVGDVVAQTKNIKELSKVLTGPVGTVVALEMMDTNGNTTEYEVIRKQFLNRSTPTQ